MNRIGLAVVGAIPLDACQRDHAGLFLLAAEMFSYIYDKARISLAKLRLACSATDPRFAGIFYGHALRAHAIALVTASLLGYPRVRNC